MNDVLQKALDVLSDAHGVAELRSAFRLLQRKVRNIRGQDHEGNTLGAVVMEAVVYREKLKADGASTEEADAGLEVVIRERWPKPHDRTVPWRYICELCGDTGLQMLQCKPGMRCNGLSIRTDSPHDKPGKYLRMCVGSNTSEHDYGVPCVCARGTRFMPKQQNRSDDDFRSAAKSKPKPLAKWGR